MAWHQEEEAACRTCPSPLASASVPSQVAAPAPSAQHQLLHLREPKPLKPAWCPRTPLFPSPVQDTRFAGAQGAVAGDMQAQGLLAGGWALLMLWKRRELQSQKHNSATADWLKSQQLFLPLLAPSQVSIQQGRAQVGRKRFEMWSDCIPQPGRST